MVPTLAEIWCEAWKAEGIAEGKAEGIADVLLRLLKRKFGDVPPEWETRVRRGTVAELMTWTDRVLDAQSLKAVFFDS